LLGDEDIDLRSIKLVERSGIHLNQIDTRAGGMQQRKLRGGEIE
jgi:hypothetical protein